MRVFLFVEMNGEFLPADSGFLEAADGEGVHQFVGVDHGVSLAGLEGILRAAVPSGAPAEALFLVFGQRDGGFD